MIIKSSNDTNQLRQEIISMIQELELTYDKFRGLTILNDKFVTDSIKAGFMQEIENYDMGALFRIITQNDQIHYFDLEVNNQKPDSLSMSLNEKQEYALTLQPNQMNVLCGCFIHIFDSQLNPEALQLVNIMGAMVTDQIIPFLTTHIVV